MKKIFNSRMACIVIMLILSSSNLFAATGYDEIFAPLVTLQSILKYLGSIVLIISLIAQGIIIFFGDNIPEAVKKTMGKAAAGACFIGGAGAIAGFIIPSSNTAFIIQGILYA